MKKEFILNPQKRAFAKTTPSKMEIGTALPSQVARS
jgi:hypothetical protein